MRVSLRGRKCETEKEKGRAVKRTICTNVWQVALVGKTSRKWQLPTTTIPKWLKLCDGIHKNTEADFTVLLNPFFHLNFRCGVHTVTLLGRRLVGPSKLCF